MKLSKLFSWIGGVGIGASFSPVMSACVSHFPYAGHCINQTGDEFCREKYGDSKAFCQEGSCEPFVDDGCVAQRPEDDACYSPCGDGKTLADDPDAECEGVAETGTDATTLTSSMSDTTPSTSGDPTTMSSMSMSDSDTETDTTVDATMDPTTGPTGCVTSLDCTDPGNPVCVDEACVPCGDAADGDAACEAKDPDAPACRDDGECVQCTGGNPAACDGETPVCDDGASACVGCTYHEQCAESACRINTGACFATDCVVEVDGVATTINDAIGDGCVLLLMDAVGGYDENIVVGSSDVVAILAAPGVEFPAIIGLGADTDPTIEVSGGAELYLQGVEISGNSGVGIAASSGRVYLDRVAVVNNDGGGTALVNGAFAQVRNCFVSGNGNEAVASRGLNVTDSTLDLSYSTVVRNDAGTDDSLVCNDGATVNVRNSVLVGRDSPSITCVPLDATFSVFDEAVAGQGNESVAMLDTGWFIDVFLNDFHLSGSGATQFADVAQWQSGDPAVDIDGDDPRPNVDGTADVAGADVP